jgi:hypothetical protein
MCVYIQVCKPVCAHVCMYMYIYIYIYIYIFIELGDFLLFYFYLDLSIYSESYTSTLTI